MENEDNDKEGNYELVLKGGYIKVLGLITRSEAIELALKESNDSTTTLWRIIEGSRHTETILIPFNNIQPA